MPESFPSLPDARCSALEKFCSNLDLESFKDQCQGRQMTPIHTNCGNPGGNQHPLLAPSNVQTSPGSSARTRPRGSRGGARTNPRPKKAPPPQKRVGRKPGTSRFYGVRFRPDLRKWVAEIRVQEWKEVDKKVWLGTFDTEQAAARGVDLARKLLKCKKKHHPNLPNPKLTAYSKQIPAHLILTELGTPAMFRSATHFIKHECKQYAASFDDDDDDDTPIAAQLTSPNPQSSNITGGLPFFNEAQNLYDFNAGDATSINMLDFVESEESELSSLIPFCGDLAIHDQLEVDSSMTTYNRSFELGMSSSPSPSPSSSASCMTLEAVQAQSECPVVLGWESGDVGGCEDGASETMADLMDGVSMMESMMAVDGDGDAGAASQLWAEDASLFRFWPSPQQDPSSSYPPGYLPELPDALFGLTSYMAAWPGNCIAPLDLEPWSLQGAHNPLYGPYGWH